MTVLCAVCWFVDQSDIKHLYSCIYRAELSRMFDTSKKPFLIYEEHVWLSGYGHLVIMIITITLLMCVSHDAHFHLNLLMFTSCLQCLCLSIVQFHAIPQAIAALKRMTWLCFSISQNVLKWTLQESTFTYLYNLQNLHKEVNNAKCNFSSTIRIMCWPMKSR